MMKKIKMMMAMGIVMSVLSACGQAENPEENPADVTGAAQISDDTVESKDDVLESLTGEYSYLSDYGTGKLSIKKTSHGYDISDYESESSYRFLADSSNIETTEDNRIYIKYPEQTFSDGEAVFSYYILEYSTDGIGVYYGKSSFKEAEFLYHATKITETVADVYEYEGVYNDYDVNEPALEIKKNNDGTYRIQIDLYRLFLLDDGIGMEMEDGLAFTASGPGDGDDKVNGVITLDEDIATVTILGQEWTDFAGINEFRFYKSSDVSANQQEDSVHAVENADSEATAEELLDLFISGSISAAASTDSTFYITDLNRDSEEWNSYSVGEKVDLDNDGENELIINGPYGGIYLDARDNKVYEFAAPGGTALTLSYTYYNGAVWIMYSNRSSAGFEFYHMEKFEGADNLAAEMNFGEEFDINNAEAGAKYTLNETEISYDEYTELCSKIFAAEVNTN